MNAYTTQGRARIRQQDIGTILRTDKYLAASSLEALERQRGGQAEAEVNWLLKQHGATRNSAVSLVPALRKTVGAALIRAGQRLTGAPHSGTATVTAATGSLGVAAARQ